MISASIKNRWRLGVVGVVVEDLLERDLAVQLGIERHENRAEAPARVRPEHAESLAVAGGRSDGIRRRAVAIAAIGQGTCRPNMAESRLNIGVADPRQALLRRFAGGDGGEALVDVAAVGFQMKRGQPLEQRPAGSREIASTFQVIGQAPGFVERPGLERRNELDLVDDTVLEREEQSEEEMAIGSLQS